MKTTTKFAKRAAVVIASVACLILLVFPFGRELSGNEFYECVWADGSVTGESYSSAYQSLVGMDEGGIVLLRNGLTGRVKSEARRVYETLEEGGRDELLYCFAEGTRIDRAALYRTFSDRAWFDGNYYIWTGTKIERVSRVKKSELVVLSGKVSARVLRECGARSVSLRAEAEVTTGTFASGGVKVLRVQPPYEISGGALYANTAAGKRLVAALVGAEELAFDSDLKFIDEGALLVCDKLVSLTLPFLGSAESPDGAEYKGELAHLFSDGAEYRVPQSLARVKVTGGRIIPFAFYACSGLKEIDVCGVSEKDIAETAFTGLSSLEILHTPKKSVILTGDFTASEAECGCTVYRRIYSQK